MSDYLHWMVSGGIFFSNVLVPKFCNDNKNEWAFLLWFVDKRLCLLIVFGSICCMDGTEHNIDASTIAHWIVPNSNHNHIVLLGTVVGDVSRLSSASSSWEGGIHTYIHTHKRAQQHHVYRFGVTNGTSKIETSQWVWESWEIWKILLAVPTALQTHKTCSESWTFETSKNS